MVPFRVGQMKSAYLLIVSMISIMWLWSGVLKLVDINGFERVIHGQDALPDSLIGVAAIVWPLFEVSIGIVMAYSCGASRVHRREIVVSLFAVLALSLYIASIPAPRIERVGCGCHGAWNEQAARSFDVDSKTAVLLVNTGLSAIHLAALMLARGGGFGSNTRAAPEGDTAEAAGSPRSPPLA